jgi:hypothetical protein
MISAPYTGDVELFPDIEDERGVDISQIRRQLRMSVEERVRSMVDTANTLMEIRASVRFIDVPPDR